MEDSTYSAINLFVSFFQGGGYREVVWKVVNPFLIIFIRNIESLNTET